MELLYSIKIRAIFDQIRGEGAAFWYLCLYLFIEYVRPQSIYPVIEGLPFGQVFIILTMWFYLVGREKVWITNPENKLFVLFFLLILLSSVFAYYPTVSYESIVIPLNWLIVYFLFVNIINNEKRFFIIYLSFLLYNFKMSQHGFLSWASYGFGFRNWGVTGAPGWFENSGEFGIEMCIFLPLVITFIIALKEYWGKLKLTFFLLLPFTAFASIVASSSRGALIGCLGALFWLVIKSKYRFKSILSLIVIVSIIIISVPEESMMRFNAAGEDHTSQARLIRWGDGIDMLNKHPILGIGYSNWMSYYRLHYDTSEGGHGLSHNMFIEAGSELGYPGLIVFILMIIYTFKNNAGTRKNAIQAENKFTYYTAHGLDAALIGFLISGFFVTVLYYPFFWINMAFTVALNNISKKKINKSISGQDNQLTCKA